MYAKNRVEGSYGPTWPCQAPRRSWSPSEAHYYIYLLPKERKPLSGRLSLALSLAEAKITAVVGPPLALQLLVFPIHVPERIATAAVPSRPSPKSVALLLRPTRHLFGNFDHFAEPEQVESVQRQVESNHSCGDPRRQHLACLP